MPEFGKTSLAQLATVHPDLRRLFNIVIIHRNCTVLEGRRTHAQQAANVEKGVSETMESKHLPEFSAEPEKGVDAVDVAPWPLLWPQKPKDDSPGEAKRWMKECARYYWFAGYVQRTAENLGIRLRWGGDWDGDGDIIEQNFDDLPHFERIVG